MLKSETSGAARLQQAGRHLGLVQGELAVKPTRREEIRRLGRQGHGLKSYAYILDIRQEP